MYGANPYPQSINKTLILRRGVVLSRSFKKNPVCKVKYRHGQQLAKRRVRNYTDIPNGSAYKRVYPMWDVIEYKFTYNWEEYKKLHGDDYRHWYKYYKAK